MALLTPSDCLVPSPEVVLREDFNDTAVLFQPLTAEAIALNEVGVANWKALDGHRTLAEVAAAVAAQCDAPPASVLDDTMLFVTHLHRRLFVMPLLEVEPP